MQCSILFRPEKFLTKQPYILQQQFKLPNLSGYILLKHFIPKNNNKIEYNNEYNDK